MGDVIFIMDKVRVFCVLVKPKYTFSNVLKLEKQLRQHLHLPFEMVCLTDHEELIYDNIKLINIASYDLETWWNKVLIFSDKFSSNINLYFDLDIEINDNITSLVDQLDNNHIFVVDTPWKNHEYFAQKYKGVRAYKIADALFHYGNTSVMGWKGHHQYLVDHLLSDIFTHTSKHFGDDTFINRHGKVEYFNFDIKRAGGEPAAILI